MMNKRICMAIWCGMVSAMIAQGYSNPIEGGSTEVITNAYQAQLPWYMVGGNTAGNSLVVTDGGQVDNLIGYIGHTAGSSNNSAIVTGAGSVWDSSMELSIGRDGSGNQLTIANGGRVDTANGYVGSNSVNNTVHVRDPGSLLNATTLHVGLLGSDNSLTVSDGGRVETTDGTIGYWIGADNNTLTVQGSNSLLHSSGVINVGDYGSGNQLTIDAGGRVESPVVNLGAQSLSSNNTVTVAGIGSILDAPEIHLGGSAAGAGGTGNLIEVENGGTLATTDLNIYEGNQFDLNSGGTLAVNTNFNASLSGFNFNSGGTLEVGGELTGMSGSIEDQRTLVMNGSNAVWNPETGVVLGGNGFGNRIEIVNGAEVSASSMDLGGSHLIKTSNNSVQVQGEGSSLNVEDTIMVGHYGSSNSLEISEGGYIVANKMIVGRYGQSSNNIVQITGDGSSLNTVDVVLASERNTMNITNGGVVNSQWYGIVGQGTTGIGNTMNVSGIGSKWLVGRTVEVGSHGVGNRLNISTGGLVSDDWGIIGFGSPSINEPNGVNNVVVVSGVGSVWENRKKLFVGYNSGENSLRIDNGGLVMAREAYVGNDSTADENTVWITGEGSVWSNSQDLVVGHYGSRNEVTILDGGVVTSESSYIGKFSGKNSMVVSGEDSGLDASEYLVVGHRGSHNTLLVSNGGAVSSKESYIGNEVGSGENHVTVSGKDSIWTNETYLEIGFRGNGNRLDIEDGGVVYSDKTLVGHQDTSSGNLVTVSGDGSALISHAEIQVGSRGASNRLDIVEGGMVFGNLGYLGAFFGSDNNSALVSGEGSEWNVRELIVGYEGAFNRLDVLNGGMVGGSNLYFGAYSDNNWVMVSGEGSSVVSIEDTVVGYSGDKNSLTINAGGKVFSRKGFIGSRAGADNNTLIVSESGSRWMVSQSLAMGGEDNGTNWIDGGTGNSLTVSNGGWVQVGDVGTNNIPDHGALGVVSVGGLGGAEMVVANGSRVENDLGYVGIDADMSGSVTVTGTGSIWENTASLDVGIDGSDNSLSILNGARVESSSSYIGYGTGASNNSVAVSGSGSVWNNRISPRSLSDPREVGPGVIINDPITSQPIYNDLRPSEMYVGYKGSENSLSISDGGEVLSGNGVIGLDEAAHDNTVLVTGNGSLWDSEGAVFVGVWGSGNRLHIADGARVQSEMGFIGEGGAENNRVVISGEGSSWSIGAESFVRRFSSPGFSIGYAGSDNSLLIEDGGRVQNVNGVIGYTENANGNRVIVSGADSVWKNTGSWNPSIPRPVQNVFFETDLRNVISPFNPVQTGVDPLTGQTIPFEAFDWSEIKNSVFILRSGIDPITGQTVPVYESVDTGRVYLTNATMLALSMGDLSVGRGGSYNSLVVEDGALVSNDHGIIGETSNAWNNAVSVVGTNSEWRSSGDLYMGGRMSKTYTITSNGWENSWINGGRENSLYVADGGLVSVGRDMHNRNYSTVSIDPGGHISISSNYYQDATSVLRFGVETNAVGAPLNPFVSVGGTAEFEEGATLQYHSNVGVLDFDTFYTNLIVEANQLIIAGITNANAVDLQALNLDGSLVEVLLWEQNQDIYGLVGRRYLADSAGFVPGSQMALLSKEIDDLSLLGNPTAVSHINLLNGMSSAQQNAQLTQRYTQGTPTYRHRQGVLGGQKQVMAQSRAFQSASRSRAAKPEGAAGPHKAGQELRGWMRGYGSWASHDGTPRSFSGFDQNVYGTVVGLDKAYGNVLLGAAGGYARSDLTQENNDSSDAKTGFGVLYSSFGSVDWFGDLNLSYGRSAIQTHSGIVLGGEGDFDADNFAIYLGGGKEIQPEDSSLLFTPEAALTVGYYGQEAYNDGLMDVDAYDYWNCQSRLGAALAVETQAGSVVLKPEARVYWLHEFNADPDQIGYSLIGGGGNYSFGIQAPEEDIFEVGVGFSATFSDRLELALDVDAQQSGLYHAVTVGARARYEF